MCFLSPWLSVGDEETDAGVSHPPTGLFQSISQIEGVERARAVLEEHGGDVSCHRYRGGHAFEHWRAELSDALLWLLRAEKTSVSDVAPLGWPRMSFRSRPRDVRVRHVSSGRTRSPLQDAALSLA